MNVHYLICEVSGSSLVQLFIHFDVAMTCEVMETACGNGSCVTVQQFSNLCSTQCNMKKRSQKHVNVGKICITPIDYHFVEIQLLCYCKFQNRQKYRQTEKYMDQIHRQKTGKEIKQCDVHIILQLIKK